MGAFADTASETDVGREVGTDDLSDSDDGGGAFFTSLAEAVSASCADRSFDDGYANKCLQKSANLPLSQIFLLQLPLYELQKVLVATSERIKQDDLIKN